MVSAIVSFYDIKKDYPKDANGCCIEYQWKVPMNELPRGQSYFLGYKYPHKDMQYLNEILETEQERIQSLTVPYNAYKKSISFSFKEELQRRSIAPSYLMFFHLTKT